MNLLKKYPIEYSFDIKTRLPHVSDIKSFIRHLKIMQESIEDLIHPEFSELVKCLKGDWTFALVPIYQYGAMKKARITTLYFTNLDDVILAKLMLR